MNSLFDLINFKEYIKNFLFSLWIRPLFTIIPFNSMHFHQICKFRNIFDMRPCEINDLAVASRHSSFHLNTSSNCFSCLISSLDEIITSFAFSSSRKAYLSVDGRVLRSNQGSSIGSSSNHASSSIIITSSMVASISWSLANSMAPKSSEAREGYFKLVDVNLHGVLSDDAFYVVVKTHKRWSNKIYNSKLTMTKI